MAERKEKCPKCRNWYVDLSKHKVCRGREDSVVKTKGEDKVQCPQCEKWYVDLSKHKVCRGREDSVVKTKGEDKVQCPQCEKWYVDLSKHKVCRGREDSVVKTKGEDKVQCPHCEKWYVDLSKHKVCHGRKDSVVKTKGEDKVQCPQCEKWYVDLSKHKVCHGREDSVVKTKGEDKVQCPQCEKWYVDLSKHKVCHGREDSVVKTKGEDKVQCPQCEKWYVDLSKHKVCHGREDSVVKTKGEDKVQCPQCEKWYVDLSKHKVCHGREDSVVKTKGEDKVQCPHCEKWYVDLSKHKVCHGREDSVVKTKGEDKVQCPHCEKWYVDLSKHKVCRGREDSVVKTKGEDKVQCPQCEKWYVDLSKHRVCHGREDSVVKTKGEDKVQCPHCEKWYVDLSKHKVCHGREDSVVKTKGGDKVQCPQCEKWYVDLSKHKVCHGREDSLMKTEEDDKVQCPQCYDWYVNLENHKVCSARKCSRSSDSAKVKEEDGRKQCPNCLKWYVSLEKHLVCYGRCTETANAVKEEQAYAVIKPTQSSPGPSVTNSEPKCSPSRVSHSSTGLPCRSMDTQTVAKMEEFVRSMIDNKVIDYSGNPRSDILRFFEDEVQLRKNEIETAAKHFQMLQQSVVEFLGSKTPWNWKAFRAGSHYDGTKVSRPNEMDCVLYPDLSENIDPVYEGCVTGFCRAKVKTLSQDIEHICDGRYINKSKFRKFIFSIMDDFVRENQTGTRCKPNIRHALSPAYAVMYTGVSTDYGSLHIDVDFVPALHVPHWPPRSVTKDLRKLPKDISPNIIGETIMAAGINLVTTSCPGHPADQDLQWKVSCSYAEKYLTKYGENTCWKPVLRTMKRVVEIAKGIKGLTITGKSLEIQKAAHYIRSHYFEEETFCLCFPTYYIRSLMWHMLYEMTLGNRVWKVETQEARLHSSLKYLQKMTTGELVVPHFFIPGIRDIMSIRRKDREFMYMLVRATEIVFTKRTRQ